MASKPPHYNQAHPRPALVVLSTVLVFIAALLIPNPLRGLPSIPDSVPATRWVWNNITSITWFCLLLGGGSIFAGVILVGYRKTPALLGLGQGKVIWRHIPAMMLAVLFLTYVGFLLRGLVFPDGTSAQLSNIDGMFAVDAGGVSTLLLATMAVGPALGEELLFRGLLLSGLRGKLPQAFIIVLVAVAFICMHRDPQHMLSIAPIAIWLTLIAWRQESIWPSVLCHLSNNLTVGLLISVGAANSVQMEAWVHCLVLGIALPCFLFSVWRLTMVPQAKEALAPSPLPPA